MRALACSHLTFVKTLREHLVGMKSLQSSDA